MKKQVKSTPGQKAIVYNVDKDYSKYYWLIVPLLVIIYYIYSRYSNGFYQDDEVAHFINMRDFWTDPFIIMSNWGKPGWKIFMVLPSLLGYDFVVIFNSIITAVTAYFTILLAKELKLKNSILAGILFAFQPHLLQLAFRSYAEIFTGLLLVLTLYFYFKDKLILSALMCGLAFTVRQESALLCLILAIFMAMRKKYVPILYIAIFPLIINLIGFLKTGDPIWAWTEMQSLSDFNLGIDRSFFHYFQVLIYIAGPVVFTLFLVGVVYPFTLKDKKEFINRELIVYLFFFVVLLFQCYLVVKGTNPGSWRYLLQVSPFAAIIALIGFDQALNMKMKKYVLSVFAASAVIILLFLSKESTGLLLTEKSEFLKLLTAAALIAGFVLMVLMSREIKFHQILILTILLSVGYTFYTEKPKQQGPENITVNQMADWYKSNADKSTQVLYNHSLILFYGDIFGEQKKKFTILTKKSLEESPKGTIVIWDSHYSYRPEYKYDTQLELLQNNPNFKLLNQFMSSDKRFGAFIFEKL
ncbi:MAG: hypothetical protein K8I03_15365 [Ignavibacteria bacterium]|nr:hypothetical protein [Ignavibacteria bacterium]